MKGGSVIIDISIDQGGCVQTSRPTTLDDPTYSVHDVVHYCVPNMTANIARTASRALADAMHPYLLNIGSMGLAAALNEDRGLAEGVYLYRGKVVSLQLASTIGIEPATLRQLTAGDAES
jgi:alanine dehydrogenase